MGDTFWTTQYQPLLGDTSWKTSKWHSCSKQNFHVTDTQIFIIFHPFKDTVWPKKLVNSFPHWGQNFGPPFIALMALKYAYLSPWVTNMHLFSEGWGRSGMPTFANLSRGRRGEGLEGWRVETWIPNRLEHGVNQATPLRGRAKVHFTRVNTSQGEKIPLLDVDVSSKDDGSQKNI